jgi:hypothetical protein
MMAVSRETTMNQQPDHTTNNSRRVVLPSGKTIEVVYFDAVDETAVEDFDVAGENGVDLSHCENCESHLVYPVDWAEAGNDGWEVELRCPNCEWHGAGTYEQHVVDRFDMELDRGTVALMEDLHALVRANMEDEIERFVRALNCDHVLPEDF